MAFFELPRLKVLGALCMIDEGELDWKIIALEEAYAKKFGIRDLETLNQHNPGAVADVTHWFRIYKTFDGKPENSFGYNDQCLGVERTIEIIEENHQAWKDLCSGKVENKDGLWIPK